MLKMYYTLGIPFLFCYLSAPLLGRLKTSSINKRPQEGDFRLKKLSKEH